MDMICQNLCKMKAPELACAIAPMIVKKNQMPIFDIIGPFPDETILAGVDRALYFLGAGRAQESLHLPITLMDSSNIECSIPVSYGSQSDSYKSCRTSISDSPRKENLPSCIKVHSKNKGCCSNSTSGRSSKNYVPQVQICEPQPRSKNLLKRSFSLCSLACRKLKEMLTFPEEENEPKWFWARTHSTSNGCEVYEIFKNSNVCSHPNDLGKKHLPQVIFVVLQNGTTMPFEIMPSS